MLELLLLVFGSVGFCGLIYYLLFPPLTTAAKQFNGPPKLPILGNVLDFAFITVPHEGWKKFSGLCQTYKSPMVMQFGPVYVFHIFDADQLEPLMKSSVNINKSFLYDFLKAWLGRGLLTSTGPKWKNRRKMLTPAFHFNILKDFIPVFNEQAEILCEILSEKMKESNGAAVDVYQLITKCTLDIICETAMGAKLHAQRNKSDYVNAIYTFSDLTMKRIARPWQWNDTMMQLLPGGSEWSESVRTLHSFTKKVIYDRETSLEKTSANGQSAENGASDKKRRLAFLDLLLSMKKEGKITDEGIREEVDTFMFEGHDTTSGGIVWTLYTLGLYPEIQEKVHKELDLIFEGDTERTITSEDVNKMTYLECVIKETQRILPSVPGISRVLTEPLQLPDGKTVPEGARVDINFQRLHMDPKNFPNPKEFNPDRFTVENSRDRHPFAFMPFSAGPRNCIGQKFAMLEEKIVLAHILRNFTWVSTQSMDELNEAVQLVLRPTSGINGNTKLNYRTTLYRIPTFLLHTS